jgi:twitching motility protein PilI
VLLVDRLSGLRSEEELTRDADDNEARPPFAGARFRDASARVWQELHLAELAGDESFLRIVG